MKTAMKTTTGKVKFFFINAFGWFAGIIALTGVHNPTKPIPACFIPILIVLFCCMIVSIVVDSVSRKRKKAAAASAASGDGKTSV